MNGAESENHNDFHQKPSLKPILVIYLVTYQLKVNYDHPPLLTHNAVSHLLWVFNTFPPLSSLDGTCSRIVNRSILDITGASIRHMQSKRKYIYVALTNTLIALANALGQGSSCLLEPYFTA